MYRKFTSRGFCGLCFTPGRWVVCLGRATEGYGSCMMWPGVLPGTLLLKGRYSVLSLKEGFGPVVGDAGDGGPCLHPLRKFSCEVVSPSAILQNSWSFESSP